MADVVSNGSDLLQFTPVLLPVWGAALADTDFQHTPCDSSLWDSLQSRRVCPP